MLVGLSNKHVSNTMEDSACNAEGDLKVLSDFPWRSSLVAEREFRPKLHFSQQRGEYPNQRVLDAFSVYSGSITQLVEYDQIKASNNSRPPWHK